MKLQASLPLVASLLLGVAQAGTIVRWYGCSGEYQQTETNGDGCTNVSGFKTDNLCQVWVPPPGTDRCEFYTTSCGNPFGSTYKCNVGSSRCETRNWPAIDSYRCYAS